MKPEYLRHDFARSREVTVQNTTDVIHHAQSHQQPRDKVWGTTGLVYMGFPKCASLLAISTASGSTCKIDLRSYMEWSR